MARFQRGIRQIAALPVFFSPHCGLEVCLVTTRGGGRWLIPKGNPIPGLAAHEAAAHEAMEEAGLLGEACEHPIGSFDFVRRRHGFASLCTVDVYLLRVERRLPAWPEMGERSVIRCDPQTAATLISTPGLADLVSGHCASLRRLPLLAAWEAGPVPAIPAALPA